MGNVPGGQMPPADFVENLMRSDPELRGLVERLPGGLEGLLRHGMPPGMQGLVPPELLAAAAAGAAGAAAQVPARAGAAPQHRGEIVEWSASSGDPPPFAPWRLQSAREVYADKLKQLRADGFLDDALALSTLRDNGGDVETCRVILESLALDSGDGDDEAVAPAATGADSGIRPDAQVGGAGGGVPAGDAEEAWLSQATGCVDFDWADSQGCGQTRAPKELCRAVMCGSLPAVNCWLAIGGPANLWFVDDSAGVGLGRFELLRVAAVEGHSAVCRALLAAGARIDHEVEGRTVLFAAAWAGQEDTVKTLLAAGADASRACDGGHAISVAAAHDHAAVVSLLLCQPLPTDGLSLRDLLRRTQHRGKCPRAAAVLEAAVWWSGPGLY